MAKLGRGVDELEINLLQGSLLGVCKQRFPKGQNSLLGSNGTPLSKLSIIAMLRL